ncbi:bacteriophage N4 receptor, outer membrane subunit [Streptomyces sp. YIM 130001]|uniref:tetratricopeptide repeat protein n=1 Tax=Streptomyces sp. YIM 130001 TaxID=2259644 RepID=UPI000E6569B3|nr:tetratricopeptide repeat protein [Streptomyces sp. YIM 130001]RII09395.1 bacteriophage N4 receptor, outer membrane subunit [Streptomyces sp. YIM 130001]
MTTGSGPGCSRDELLAEGVRLRESGRREEARTLLVDLAARHPGDAEVAHQAAWVHDVLGLEAEAVPYYLAAVEADGLEPGERCEALLGLGSTYRVLGKYPEAVATLRAAVEEFPGHGGLKTFLSMALYNAGHHHEAMQLLLALLASTSDDANITAYRAAIEAYAEDLDATV